MNEVFKPTSPEIRINFSYLLYGSESPILVRDLNGDTSALEQPSHYMKVARAYQSAWDQYESTLLQAMQISLGVSFYRQVIDVSLAPYFVPHSDPLIINFRYIPDRFLDILTHELIHVLLTDNSVHQNRSLRPRVNLLNEWKKIFGEQTNSVLAHIPVHALHKHLYLDVLHAPERLERDVEAARKSPTGNAYAAAWDYVNSHNYMEIVNALRKIYAD